MLNETTKILYFIRGNWYNKFGLLATTILALVLLKLLFGSAFQEALPPWSWPVPYLIFFGLIFLCWIRSRVCYPKNKKNRIGILIGIYTENQRDEIRIKNDFIRGMKNLISSRSLGHIFNIVVPNNYQSHKIETGEQALDISNKTRSHFVVCGEFKKRQFAGRSMCVLNLRLLVRHTPIKDLAVRTQFRQEFGRIFPKGIRFPERDELPGFELTTSIIHEAVMYLLGKAALFSGDVFLSLELHKDLYQRIRQETLAEKVKQLKIIEDTLPKLLGREYTLAAHLYYISEQNRDMAKVKECCQMAIKYSPEIYNAHLLLAICFFLEKKPDLASQEVKKAKKIAPRDVAVRYSEAFLYFYGRNFTKGETAYKKAVRESVAPQTLFPVESFIADLIERELDKTYFYYPLGLINYRVKEDYILATDYFQKFIQSCEDDLALAKLVEKAKMFLKEIAAKKRAQESDTSNT